jgi:hypothetical protein
VVERIEDVFPAVGENVLHQSKRAIGIWFELWVDDQPFEDDTGIDDEHLWPSFTPRRCDTRATGWRTFPPFCCQLSKKRGATLLTLALFDSARHQPGDDSTLVFSGERGIERVANLRRNAEIDGAHGM